MEQVKCPYCGYRMPERYAAAAMCKGVFVRCKNKICRREFEIKIGVK